MTKHYSDKEIDDLLSKFPISTDNKKATRLLLENFSEFKDSEFYGQTDESIPYLVFADFCQFLIRRIEETLDVNKDQILKRAGEFISNLYNSDSKDLKDLVIVGIFENLANDIRTECLINLLTKETGEVFKKFFSK